jgi:hypothetical protein
MGWVPVAHAYNPTQEAEITRLTVQSQPEQIVNKTLSRKTLPQKNWAYKVAQSEGPELKPQYRQKKKAPSTHAAVTM